MTSYTHIIIQGDQNVYVHLTITNNKGVHRDFYHPVFYTDLSFDFDLNLYNTPGTNCPVV